MAKDFKKPVQLIKSIGSELSLNEKSARLIENIDTDLVVIAIAGKYRTGKSYILNLLSDLPRNKGFELGSTVQSKTKGIWTYALPHPLLPDTTLLLLDTEGLGDVEKGDIQYDTNLLILTILLSSTFILNVQHRLDSEVINQLSFVCTLAKKMISTRYDYQKFLPQLYVLIRDFALDLVIKGKEVTADEYFDDFCLKVKGGVNDPSALIRKYFPQRHCVTLPLPIFNRKLLRVLDTVPDEDLNPEFLEESVIFVQKLLSDSKKKSICKGKSINGKMLIDLLRNYLHGIKNNEVPCIETTLRVTANAANEKLYQEFISLYKKSMRAQLQLPTTFEIIRNLHNQISYECMQKFMGKIIFEDYTQRLQSKFKYNMDVIYENILSENSVLSRKFCQSRLKNSIMYRHLNRNLERNYFCKPGGINEFCAHVNNIINEYNRVKQKEVKHDEVLSEFLQEMNEEGNRIYWIEKSIVEAQRKAEEAEMERQRAIHLAEMESALMEETRRQNEELERRNREHLRRMERELEEQREKEEELKRKLEQNSRPSNDAYDSSDDEVSCTIL